MLYDVQEKKRNSIPSKPKQVKATSKQQLKLVCEFKGVRQLMDTGRWQARITINRKDIVIGCQDSKLASVNDYDAAALYVFGAKAKVNIPRTEDEIQGLVAAISAATKTVLDNVSSSHVFCYMS